MEKASGKRFHFTNKDTGGVIIDVDDSVMTFRDYLHASAQLKRVYNDSLPAM